MPARRGTPARWWRSAAAPGPARVGAASFGLRLPRPAPRGATARLDALVAPARVLLGQTNDERLHLIVERRSPSATARVGPGASDQPPMPAQQRLWRDEKT